MASNERFVLKFFFIVLALTFIISIFSNYLDIKNSGSSYKPYGSLAIWSIVMLITSFLSGLFAHKAFNLKDHSNFKSGSLVGLALLLYSWSWSFFTLEFGQWGLGFLYVLLYMLAILIIFFILIAYGKFSKKGQQEFLESLNSTIITICVIASLGLVRYVIESIKIIYYRSLI